MNSPRRTYLEVCPEVHFRHFHNELVLLHVGIGEYFSLDEVGARVWAQLARGADLEDVVDALAQDYDVDVAVLRNDVHTLASELVRRRLMVLREAPDSPTISTEPRR